MISDLSTEAVLSLDELNFLSTEDGENRRGKRDGRRPDNGLNQRTWEIDISKNYTNALKPGSDLSQKLLIGEWWVDSIFSMRQCNRVISISSENPNLECLTPFCREFKQLSTIPLKLVWRQRYTTFALEKEENHQGITSRHSYPTECGLEAVPIWKWFQNTAKMFSNKLISMTCNKLF